jgi:hypothetical protein
LTFETRDIAASVGDCPIRELVLYQKDFGWMAFWELNPEALGSLWLKAFGIWRGGGSLRRKASVTGEVGRAPFELHPGICL